MSEPPEISAFADFSDISGYIEAIWPRYVADFLDETMLTPENERVFKDKLRRCVREFCVERLPLSKAERWLSTPPCLPVVPVCSTHGPVRMRHNPFYRRCQAVTALIERTRGFGHGWQQTLDVVQVMSVVAAVATCVIAFSALVNLFITLRRSRQRSG